MTAFGTDDVTLSATILATCLPLASFVLIALVTRSRPWLSAWLSIGAVTVSLVCSVVLLGCHWGMEKPIQITGRWLTANAMEIPFGFLIDPASLLMLAIVAAISFLVQVYSLGYMAGDAGFSRYYAFMSLFAWAMLNLVLAATILQLYIFWELVGLSSYLLIGFWYEKFSATQAGKKAFVMTRTGDVAFFLGLLVVLLHLGNFNISEMNGPEATMNMSPGVLTLSALLIFGGIVGKSAQFPLLTWLPDAMEGPTPVSALLHSATMVAAGVYLFARLFPFLSLSPTAMTVFLTVGTISMLLASTMAMVDRDIKKVWAYSTISQLGFMIMALAAGGSSGYFGGYFHLTAHAGFKALLFLCSGVFIHYCGTNDMFELAERGCSRFKTPAITIVIGAAALSGLPPLSGFFSKEAIVASLSAMGNPLWLAAAMAGIFLTAYYAFRVVFILFRPLYAAGKQNNPPKHTASGHDSGRERTVYGAMAWPLVVLAGITAVLGLFEGRIRQFLVGGQMISGGHEAGLPAALAMTALVLALGGAGLAWVEFGRRGARQIGFVERMPFVHRLFAERWYLDHLYRFLVDRLIDRGISYLFFQNDNKAIDGGIDGMGRGTVEAGRIVAFLHQGMIQYRLIVTFAAMVLFALYFFF